MTQVHQEPVETSTAPAAGWPGEADRTLSLLGHVSAWMEAQDGGTRLRADSASAGPTNGLGSN